MSKKTNRDDSSSSDSESGFGRLREAVKQIMKSSDDRIAKMLEQITSIQATKDVAMTGNEDTQMLAVLKLGEYGKDAFESLDIAFYDENPNIRSAAAGMLAFTRRLDAIPILENFAADDEESVRDAVAFALDWLNKYGEEAPESPYVPIPDGAIKESFPGSDIIPLRTTDDVLVINEYTATPETLEYGITIKNEGKNPISNVCVSILSYPNECLSPVDELSQEIDLIEPQDSGSLIFGFKIEGEYVEGEIITSVTLVDSTGEDLAAKAGNVFVRSICNQFEALEMGADEFIALKSDMTQWNREHTVGAEASDIYSALQRILETKNLYIFQNENMERENAFMGVIAGIAKSRFSDNRIAFTLTAVGTKGDGISRLRIDVYSDNEEIVHSAASDVYETVLTDLNIVDMNGE